QKMTKVMNEGWAAYWESMMMADERFAAADEFVSYADHMAQVLGSPGLNPYKLGFELWQYIENRRNRREVVEHLLRVEGVTWRNFPDTVDLDAVMELLEPDPVVADPTAYIEELDPEDPRVDAGNLAAARDGDIDAETYPWKLLTYEGLAERHYSLAKAQNRGFLKRVGQSELEQTARYLFDTERYGSVEAAIADVDRTAGWDRMREVRESHNDVTFLDEFLTPEFVDENDYFTYEYTHTTRDFRVTSSEAADVKKKLMLQFTNFGKPTIAVHDGNFRNRNELLLAHHYNGVQLDLREAKQTLERVFELWGRPVALKTVVKELDEHDIEVARRRDKEPEPTEQGKLVRFDGESFEEEDLTDEEIADIRATAVDYDTKPDDWL
ncbi:AbrB family transcriptional regulator, partial [Halobacteriales archaeon QS_9_68_42]